MSRRSPWSEADLAALRSLYPDAPRAEVLDALPGRTWQAIRDRAARIGIARDRSKAQAAAEHAKARQAAMETDRRVLNFVIDYTTRFDFGPARIEIANGAGIAHSTVGGSVCRLKERGLLIQHPGKSRAVGLAPSLRRRLEQRRVA